VEPAYRAGTGLHSPSAGSQTLVNSGSGDSGQATGTCELSWLGRLTREVLPTDAGPIELQMVSRVAFVPWH